jgi:hypothetical protein
MTYVPLATFTGSGTHAFTNIPQTYNHLIVVNYGKGTTAAENVTLQVGNNTYDSGTNYTFRWFGSNNVGGGGYNTGQNTSLGQLFVGAIDNGGFAISTTIIMNYSSTTLQKNFIARNGGFNNSNQANCIWGGQWTNASSIINQIQFTNNFAAGSTSTIYGLVNQ